MSSVYCPLPVMNLKSSLRRTAAPIPVALMASPPSGCVDVLRSASSGQLSHRLRARRDRLHDVVVAGAAADGAFELVTGRRVVEIVPLAVHQIDRSHDHAGRAESALQAMVFAEGFLHRVQLAVVRQPLDGG